MCGTYISYWDMYQSSLKNLTGHLPAAFRVTIQYYQLIMFENFYEYINTIYGNLKLKIRVSPHALIWCCVDPQYSLFHGVTTSNLERVPVNVGAPGNTVEVGCEVPILKQCGDNLSIKSVHDVYTKPFTQLNSYGRACNIMLAGGESLIPELTNNRIGCTRTI
jgi:hypothetical protein